MGYPVRELPVQKNYLAKEHYLSKLNDTLIAVNKNLHKIYQEILMGWADMSI